VSVEHPRVSIVMPAYGSAGTLGPALDALRRQTFRDWELIVVNSSPDPDTGALMAARFPEHVFIQHPSRLLPHAARNLGLARARGDILVFTDPDCQAEPDWLAHLVAAHDAGRPVVGGAMGLRTRSGADWAVHLAKFYWLLPGATAGPRRVVCTASASYRRDAWERIGPFEGGLFIGDAVASWRAGRLGLQPWFEPRAIVWHTHEGSTAMYCRQFFARGGECGAARAAVGRWTRGHAALRLSAAPVAAAHEIIRAARAAARAGAGIHLVTALPRLCVYRGAWALGEARAWLTFTRSGRLPYTLQHQT
jgi:glycosyltransferase involved in cell wall biosynthesis